MSKPKGQPESTSQIRAVKDHFESINDYDTCCRAVVPEDAVIEELVYESSLNYLDIKFSDQIRALDLGIGTATGAQKFLRHHTGALLDGIDFSQRMLNKARINLKANDLLDRVALTEADFVSLPLKASYYDICFSMIAIHNVSHDQKQSLYSKLAGALKPGAYFICGDFIESESQHAQTAWNNFYISYLSSNLSGNELKLWTNHFQNEDKPAKLSEIQLWLHTSGFSEFGVLWQKRNLAVFFARR